MIAFNPEQNLEPLDVAVALSLYAYNVNSHERAKLVYDYFDGECMELSDMISLFDKCPAYIATELPAPSARVYVDQAIKRYGEEARNRNQINLEGFYSE